MNRRSFLKSSAAAAALASLPGHADAHAGNRPECRIGETWKGWKPGHFHVHFIYTGVCESAFYIFPDGTTMLLDCGDHNAIGRGSLAVPVLPHSGRHSGEWIARYVERVNPSGRDVDYMMLSHYHSDHAGCTGFYASKEMRDGKEYVLSGFTQAMETLRFHKAIDRAWPTFDDPLPVPDGYDSGALDLIKQFYDYGSRHYGMQVERFRLGADDQIVPVKDPGRCKNFRIFNLCANGRICSQDGTVTDLYAERIRREKPKTLNENGMSLGMTISYGPFRMFTAGDFSDQWKLEDGSIFRIEDAIADVCGKADVAKINHHGHHSMSRRLIGALRSQVYISCVWDQLHTTEDVCGLMSDREIYPEGRIICPGILPPQRRAEDDGKAWMDDVPKASYEGCHIVLDVEPGGKNYTITHIGASDESMTVRNVMRFTAR